MANYIYNETLNWVVDWINKEFATLNNIDKIEEVYVWWVAYRAVTFVDNVVTFADAVPVGVAQPTIDYFEVGLPTPTVTSDVTFLNLIDEVYDILWSNNTSPVFKLDIVKRYINKWIQKIKNEKFFKDKISSYTFNKAKDWSTIWYDANTITITNSNYIPAQGAVVLWGWAFVEYSTYSNWVFGATAGYTYKNWDDVNICYKLPTWVQKVAELLVWWKSLTYKDNREWNWINWFTIFYSLWGDRYIALPNSDEVIITVKYITPTSIYVNDTDLVDIMYEYSDVVALYASYKLCLFREDDRWQAYKWEFLEEKKKLKSYKSRATDWINNKFRSQPLLK